MKGTTSAITIAAALLATLFFTHASHAADTSLKNEQTLLIWAGIAPGSAELPLTEKTADSSLDPKVQTRVIEGISVPTVTVFTPGAKKQNGSAALIIPGGGYTQVNFDKEGADIGKWLSAHGITAFILKSRMPGDGHLDGKNAPLEDAQRALRLIRKNAELWGINPAKIGVIGSAEGGHQAAMLSTSYNKRVYLPSDDVDEVSARPDWMILLSPVTSGHSKEYLLREQPPFSPKEKQDMYNDYPVDKQVTKETPRTFIALASDDVKVDPENSVRMYTALKRAGVPVEMHIFAKGAGTFTIREAAGAAKQWLALCIEWLKGIDAVK